MLHTIITPTRHRASWSLSWHARRSLATPATVQRDPKYKRLSIDDVAHFRSFLPASSVLYAPSASSASAAATDGELAKYNVDWMRKYRGQSQLVLKPRSTEDVSKILKYCNQQRLAVVPQGGNTGVVGGSVPVFDEIIVSAECLNRVRSFDDVSGIVVCEAGCILESVDNHLGERGFMMPVDLGAKGSCHVGGNIATNAGGLRLLRYGSLHGNVLGLEVVLPDGTVLNDVKILRKDNTGYDLKQLFIGSEGTLGFVTAASILAPPRPRSINVALLGVDSFDRVLEIYKESKGHLAEILSAYEFFDRESLDLVLKHMHGHVRSPLDAHSPFYVLLETAGSDKEHDEEKLNRLLERLFESSKIMDGVVAQDSTQARAIWNVREAIPEGCLKEGATYKYDVSMPVSKLYKLVEDIRKRLTDIGLYDPKNPTQSPVTNVVGFGHLGDGNLHLNVAAKRFEPRVTNALEPFVFEWIRDVNGSVSAEHGIGVMKRNYLGYSKSPAMINYMQRVKSMFDPNGIMNPYKVLPKVEQ